MAFSPDGQTLASGGSGDATIHLWDVDTTSQIAALRGHRDRVYSVAFSPDGQTLASGSRDSTIYLWDVDTASHITTLEGHTSSVYSVAFSPDGQTLASGGWDSTIRLWDVDTASQIATLEGHRGSVSSVAFSPDGQTLASGSGDDTIRLWDVDTASQIATLEGHTSSVYSVAFSPDGQTLASGSGDRTIRLWDVDTASSGRDLWDVDTASQIATLRGHRDLIESVAFSPDGQTLASASGGRDNTIRLWKLPATRVSITPALVVSPAVGEQFSINIDIVEGQNIGGYQVTVRFDDAAVRYVESENGDYLPPGSFFVPPDVTDDEVTLGATSLAGTANGSGTLVTLTFEVVDTRKSILTLSDVILTDNSGEPLLHYLTFSGKVSDPQIGPEDVNSDGVVNILDLVKVASRFNQRTDIAKEDINGDGIVNIIDLVMVAGALGAGAAAPSLHPQALARFTAADVQKWITQAQGLNLTDAKSQRGIRFLEQLLAALTPKETVLLPNYPNPFNPETWIPYQLAESADVTLRIYAVDGTVVRTLALGHQPVGIYQEKGRAAYWDGRNQLGEPVASGVYFYTLTAGDFTATRKMLIRK